MRVMVFAKATEDSEKGAAPTAEALEAFAAMDRFTEELVKAGVFIAGAGLKNGAQAKRIICEGPGRRSSTCPRRGATFCSGPVDWLRRVQNSRRRPRLPATRGKEPFSSHGRTPATESSESCF